MSEEPCENIQDASGWVLGALSDQEAEHFATHLRDCPWCRAEVALLTSASELLLDGVPRIAPRRELRERLLAAVELESGSIDAISAQLPSAKPARRGSHAWLRTGRLVVVIAAAAAIVGLLVWHGSAQPKDTRTVLGVVTLAGGGQRAEAKVNIRTNRATLVVMRLAVAPTGRVYQAWVVPHGSPAIPTGALFSVPRSGDTQIALPSLRHIVRVIVTVEPPHGSSVPTLPAVVVVNLPGFTQS